jgi:CheY-like chemotaxis protein
MLEKVFDLFVQVDPSSNGTLGGLGVGLALVRRVIELHGGSVQARSEGKGFGTEFILRLPLSARVPHAVSTEVAQSRDAIHRLRILVVDDNKDAADSLNLLLESMGHEVFTVYDGQAAIGAAQTFRPDVVLLDIGMPQMSGYEVARGLLSAAPERKPVLVAVTGWGQESDRERATAAGIQYHFVKPMNEEVLRNVLGEVATSRLP